MATFQFRLATLQRLRQQVREQCQLDVAEVEIAGRRLAAERSLLEERLADFQAGMRSSVSPGYVDLQRLARAGEFGIRLRAQIALLSQRRSQLDDEISRRRQALVEADRELKTLEKLRERQHQQHEVILRREDQRLQDDAAARQSGPEQH